MRLPWWPSNAARIGGVFFCFELFTASVPLPAVHLLVHCYPPSRLSRSSAPTHILFRPLFVASSPGACLKRIQSSHGKEGVCLTVSEVVRVVHGQVVEAHASDRVLRRASIAVQVELVVLLRHVDTVAARNHIIRARPQWEKAWPETFAMTEAPQPGIQVCDGGAKHPTHAFYNRGAPLLF